MNVKGPDYHVELGETPRFTDKLIIFGVRLVLLLVLVTLAFFSCLGSLVK